MKSVVMVKTLSKGPKAVSDIIIILILSIAVFAVSVRLDIFNKMISWIYQHDTWQLDELFTVAIYLVVAITVYAWRRYRELELQTRQREQAEATTAQLIPELERARNNIATLRSIIPVCPECKRIRDPRGDWYAIETYLEIHYPARFHPGVCPDCARRVYHAPVLHRSGVS